MTIKDALNLGIKTLKENKVSESERSAEILLLEVINNKKLGMRNNKIGKAYLISHPEKELTKVQEKKFKNWIKRRTKHEPVWYITETVEFFGLDFFVTKDVLIPRPETELLLEKVLKAVNSKQLIVNNVLEIGVGSGCIAITLVKKLLTYSSSERSESGSTLRKFFSRQARDKLSSNNKDIEILATDVSEKALGVAKKNAGKHQVSDKIKFIHSNLFSKVAGKFDLIIANLPYIPHKDMDSLAFDIRHFEPRIALDGGKEGLEIIEEFLSQVGDYLKSNGMIFMEIGDGQGRKVKELAKKYLSNSKVKVKKDFAGFDRMVILEN